MDGSLTFAYALIVVGFLLLAAELFLPTSGTLFALSLAGIGIGVYLTFLYDVTVGWVTLVVVVLAFPAACFGVVQAWPRTSVGRRLMLSAPPDEAASPALATQEKLGALRGRIGRALSDLRPSGVAEFDGRRTDVLTEGMMVEAGHWVRCIDVQAGRVIVRPIEKPDLGDLETAVFR